VGEGPDPESSDRQAVAPIDWIAIGMTLAAIVIGTIVVLAVEPLREAVGNAIGGDTEALREEIRGLGLGGVAIFYGLVLVHTVVWYPTEIVNAAAGFVYGFWGGLALASVGWTVQGIISWYVGREVARPVLRRLTGPRRFDDAESLIERGGIPLLLAIRLVPIVPFSLTSYVCGAARVPLGRYTWTTFVGYLPLTALFVALGANLDTLSITDPLVLGGALLIVVLLFAGRPVARRLRAEDTAR
jgi:uncharacterized membrane protein YdjX (TVP38/TMEM64 family)